MKFNASAVVYLQGKLIEDNFYDKLFVEGTDIVLGLCPDRYALVDILDYSGFEIMSVGANTILVSDDEDTFRLVICRESIQQVNHKMEYTDFMENHEDDDE